MLELDHRKLLDVLSRQVDDCDTAADLAQESFSRAFAPRSSGQALLDARALVCRSARTLVVDQHRRSKVRRYDDLAAMHEGWRRPSPQHLLPKALVASQQTTPAVAIDGSVLWDQALEIGGQPGQRLRAAAKKAPHSEVFVRSDRKVEHEPGEQRMAAVQRSGLFKLGSVTEPRN